MFHIPLNLTDPEFVIDSSFVRQGLARQEDDWFAATGHELGLLWHAPGWVEGPALAEGSRAANYKTIETDVAVPLGTEQSRRRPRDHRGSAEGEKAGFHRPLDPGNER